MKILKKRFKNYNNCRFCGYYNEFYGFERKGESLVVSHWMNNLKCTYHRNLGTIVYKDDEAGRKQANGLYKRLRTNGYEIVNH